MGRTSTHRGIENVLFDIGLPDAEELSAKVILAKKINDIFGRRALTQTAAADFPGIPQPKISAIRHYKIRGISFGAPDAGADGAGPKRRDRRYAVEEEIRRAYRRGSVRHEQSRTRPVCVLIYSTALGIALIFAHDDAPRQESR
jgi:predicted XRE-type DNA-binding protein